MSKETESNIERERKISAVGAIIMSLDGRILIVQETENKPEIDKKTGDWGFPVETLKEGEDIFSGLNRLIMEEVGSLTYSFNPQKDWVGDYGLKGPKGTIWGKVFVLQTEEFSEKLNTLSSIDGEVINHRWVFPRSLQVLPRRSGVWEPLKDFLRGEREVVYRNCSPGVRF